MQHSKELMNLAADNIRILAASMVERAKSGHPGGAMGGADFINVLYSEFLNFDPEDAKWRCRDRFFLDPGHMSPMLYSQLALIGNYTIDELKQFRQWGSVTPGHPEVCQERGIENTSGPLGQGHTFAVGAAIAAKALYARTGNPGFDKEKIYAYISDGGVQEEISQGAGRLAGHLGLNNLIMFFDANEIQLSTETSAVISEDTGMKYRAWNWNVLEIDGNDADQIREALKAANEETARPTLIIGHCVMGKGCRKADGTSYEHNCKTHGAPLGDGAYVNTIKNLGGDPENPFVIRDEVKQMYEERKAELRKIVAARRAEENEWEKNNAEKASQLNDWMARKLPNIPWETVEQKPNSPTRNGSSACLSLLSEYVPNMIVSSADLCNSDKTDGFLKHTTEITRTNFAGGFLQAGVRELAMGAIGNGMALHGGVTAYVATFFVFSDYVKPMMRLAALMGLPITYVLTHDSIGVGEDGPTHEPIEQLAMLRALPNLQVFRPADAVETAAAWYTAVADTTCPTALALTRQNLAIIPSSKEGALKGGYVIADAKKDVPDGIIIASGSEVGISLEAKEILAQQGKDVRVVSMPCMELFEAQSDEYKEQVLPKAVRARVAVEAASDFGWGKYVGLDGATVTMKGFGASAPADLLFKKFGFTKENVAETMSNLLK